MNITEGKAWRALERHYAKIKDTTIAELFRADAKRVEHFSARFQGMYFDYSKNRMNAETKRLLLQLAEESGLKKAIDAMFTGKLINETEKRAVLHIAHR